MSPTVTKSIRNVALALVVVGATAGTVTVWKRYGQRDPYSGIVKRDHLRDPSASIRATGVKIRHYEGGKLVASTDADSLTVDQSRSGLHLKGIRNGVAQTATGPMQFAAKNGLLYPNVRLVDVSGGVRVKGSDFDIQTSTATIDGRKGEIRAPQPLRGRIMGGDFVAMSMEHRPGTSYTHLSQPSWTGQPPKGLAGAMPAAYQDRIWHMSSEDSYRDKGDDVHIDARAEDGEIIVMAPKIVRNLKTDVLTATGRATYRSAKADMIADMVVVYRKEGRAEFSGNVVMLVRAKKDWDKPLAKTDDPKSTEVLTPTEVRPIDPKAGQNKNEKGKPAAGNQGEISPIDKQRDDDLRSGKTLRDYPMNLKADAVTYWYRKGERHAIAKGKDATAYQEFEGRQWWRQVAAPEAHYDGEKDMLDLMGDATTRTVKLTNSIGDDFKAFKLTVSTKEDQTEDDEYMHYKGAVGTFVDRGDSDDPRDPAGKKPTDGKTPPLPDKKGDPPKKTEPPVKTGT